MKFRSPLDFKCESSFYVDTRGVLRGEIMKTGSLLALLLVTLGLQAQDRATLTGTVTDQSGAAVPNASVRATYTATNRGSETKTSPDGVYTIPYLVAGVYNVEVTGAGFQSLKRQTIQVAVGERMNLLLQSTVGHPA